MQHTKVISMGLPVYFSRSMAAKAAIKKGLRAFETFQPTPVDPSCWTFEERDMGPGIEYAESWAANKPWVHHIEITAKKIPVLIVTCMKDDIDVAVPELFQIQPITPSMWNDPDPVFRLRVRSELPALPRTSPVATSSVGSAALPQGDGTPARQPRAGGAMAICTEIYLSNPSMSKAEYIRLCEERGVFKGTAAARYTDIVRKHSNVV